MACDESDNEPQTRANYENLIKMKLNMQVFWNQSTTKVEVLKSWYEMNETYNFCTKGNLKNQNILQAESELMDHSVLIYESHREI